MENIKAITGKVIDQVDKEFYTRFEVSKDNNHIQWVRRNLNTDELLSSKIVSGNFTVESIEKDIDSNYRCINFTYYDTRSDEWIKFKTDLIGISKDLDKTLNSNGIILKSNIRKILPSYLEDLIEECNNEILKSSKVGFTDNKEKFITSRIIDCSYHKEKVELDDQFKGYFGPEGSIDEYNDMLRSCVYKAPMQLALVLGFSAITASYVKNEIDCGVLLSTLTGKSSSGKTTAFTLISSIFGKTTPNSNGGFFRNSFGTLLSITESIGKISGIPYMIDDISASYEPNKALSMEQLFYTLEGGESKSHTDKEYAKYETKKWDGLILLNAEKDLLPRTAKKGAYARTIMFKNIPWTNNAEESIKIKSCCCKNYGFYGEKYVQDLLFRNKESVANSIRYYKTQLEKELEVYTDELSDRTITKLAVILYTAYQVKNLLGSIIDFDIEGIKSLLIEAEKLNFKTRNISDYIFNIIKMELLKIKNNPDDENNIPVFKIKSVGEITKIFIIREKFEEFYLKSKMPIPLNEAIKILISKGLILTDSDDPHTTHKITVNGITERCLEFIL